MTPPNDSPQSPNIEQARHELWEGIENSREMVRQSRLLIELSECDGPWSSDEDEYPLAN